MLFRSNFILILHDVIQTHTATKTFDQPSFDRYDDLIKIYDEKLECLCSNMASKYETFVEIQPKYHPVNIRSYLHFEDLLFHFRFVKVH